ncbi:MAG: VOC family protein [Nitrososphaerales archaeon]
MENDRGNPVIHSDTSMGPVCLTVSDLQGSLSFYTSLLGLEVVKRVEDVAYLGINSESPEHLITLVGNSLAKQRQSGTTGLYHFAILVPSRSDLALAIKELMDKNYPLHGAADHLVSEALYLADPEGNGIEIYRDRPRNEWRKVDGFLEMATNPLDLPSLFAEVDQSNVSWKGMPRGTRMGHIHLQVSDLELAERFYIGTLGFQLMARYEPSAMFLSAGGYHHHLGMNTWAGTGAKPPPDNSTGLRYFTIRSPEKVEEEKIADRLRSNKIDYQEHGDSGLTFKDPFNHTVLVTSSRTASILDFLE